ncbi:sulfite exporter TauE/SafE family protein [Streptosporangium sp. NBC_01755]|uniref:sulfite exporter TauE/SafE family protein n=1 Tax=Streptosporangium sp. NBC_01755 TaxID=2975949 RepID=UPI002DD7C15D|nr:sulfite exporter TauE/SafE family protein [Streptosporangium sp. NBC_01755]WSC97908.1 sulfite exporter TauE/SafE family protein [Streptosporangium sp. NBC_01755]
MLRGDLERYRRCPLSAGAATLFAGGLAAGLVAGTTSCAAVQGGLLTGLSSGGRSACSGGRGGLAAGLSSPAAVALFLAGRSGSHVAAGILLGLVGSAVQLGPQLRAALLVVAGIVVMIFGIRTFGRERDREPEPDGHECGQAQGCGGSSGEHGPDEAADGRAPRRDAAPRRGAFSRITAPAPRAVALGAATVLLPCGVTLSTEMVAVSSGSALGGAAVMAGFVAGTAPAFALLGLILRRAAATRLAALAGVVALAAGLWTVSSGLRLGGWLPGSGGPAPAVGHPVPATDGPAEMTGGRRGTTSAGPTGAPDGPAGTATRTGGVQRIEIWATRDGYRPGVVTARAGVPTELVFRLAGDPGCNRTLTIDGRDVALPATVRLGARGAGSLRYICSMGMYMGFVHFV